MSIKLWPFRPDWSNGVLERLVWLTDLMPSTRGAEQRRPQRLTPRRELEVSFLPHERLRSVFDQLVLSKGASEWFIPLWYDVDTVKTFLPAGEDHIDTAWEHREFTSDGFAVIRPPTTADYFNCTMDHEIVKLVRVHENKIQVIRGQEGTEARDWPVGSEVYPLRLAVFSTGPRTSVVTASIASVNMSFAVTEPNEWDGNEDLSGYGRKYGHVYGRRTNLHPMTPAKNLGRVAVPAFLPDFEGFKVLTAVPDYNQELSFDYERITENLDNDNGLPRLLDMYGFSTPVQKHSWFLNGRQEHAAFRTFLYYLRGKVRPLWVPTFNADVQLIAPTAPGQLWIDIADIGYHTTEAPLCRQALAFQMFDGTWRFRRILSSAIVEGGERLEINEAFTGGLDPKDVYKISFMAVSRLEQDTIELNHDTDSAGLTTSVLTFRNVPDLRQYKPWQLTWPPLSRGCERECANVPRVEDQTNFGYPGELWSLEDAIDTARYAYELYRLARTQQYLLTPADSIQLGEFEDFLAWSIGKEWIYDPAQISTAWAGITAEVLNADKDKMLTDLAALLPPEEMSVIYGYSNARLTSYYRIYMFAIYFGTYVQGTSQLQRNHKRNWLPFAKLETIPETCSGNMLGRFCVQSTYHRDALSRYPTNGRGANTLYAAGVMYHMQDRDEENWPTKYNFSLEDVSPANLAASSHMYANTQILGNGLHASCGCIPLMFSEQHSGVREAVNGRDPSWVFWWHYAYAAWLTKNPWPTEIRLDFYDALSGGLIRTVDLVVENIPVTGWADEFTRPANGSEIPRPPPAVYSANLVVFRKTYGRETPGTSMPLHQDPWVDIWNLVPLNSKGFVVEVYPR